MRSLREEHLFDNIIIPNNRSSVNHEKENSHTHYRMMPTGVFLSVDVKDENGSMTFPLCRVHMLRAGAEVEEIRGAVMQRRLYGCSEK